MESNMNVTTGLPAVFELRRLSGDVFEAPAVCEGGARVYGGHTLCQAMLASYETVSEKDCYVLSGRFIRPGAKDRPLRYAVRRTSDGRSFSVRQVDVFQDDRLLMIVTASFQAPAAGPEFQIESAPTVPPPDELEPEAERTRPILLRHIAEGHDMQTLPSGIDGRWIDPQDHSHPVAKPGKRHAWLRVIDTLPAHHAAARIGVGYLSDYSILETGLRPHGLTWTHPSTQVASLDHTIWFHRSSDPTQWHLCQTEAVSTHSQRAFVRGEIFDPDGALVASVAQEGLLRTI